MANGLCPYCQNELSLWFGVCNCEGAKREDRFDAEVLDDWDHDISPCDWDELP